jgi:A/G-specific adenine glycosylase
MLQQTQVQTVIPYYHRFLKVFPSFRTLANAPSRKVLKQWEGLGYYSRARNLQALAKLVQARPDHSLPATYREIIQLPGIGRYTAGAVLSIAFDQDYPVVDGNVQRVLARVFGMNKDITRPQTREWFWKAAAVLLPRGKSGDYNQAIMELGALVCTPKNPRCPQCPVRSICIARKTGRQNELPLRKKKAALPHEHIGAGIIWNNGRILISQRPSKGLLGGLWEFPGGKCERGETLPHCVSREIREELGIRITVGSKMAEVKHAYSHFKITLHAYHCRYRGGTPKALGVQAWRWVRPHQLQKYPFPASNQPIIRKLLGQREK